MYEKPENDSARSLFETYDSLVYRARTLSEGAGSIVERQRVYDEIDDIVAQMYREGCITISDVSELQANRSRNLAGTLAPSASESQ